MDNDVKNQLVLIELSLSKEKRKFEIPGSLI